MANTQALYDDSYQREFDAQLLSCEPELHGRARRGARCWIAPRCIRRRAGRPNDLGKS